MPSICIELTHPFSDDGNDMDIHARYWAGHLGRCTHLGPEILRSIMRTQTIGEFAVRQHGKKTGYIEKRATNPVSNGVGRWGVKEDSQKRRLLAGS